MFQSLFLLPLLIALVSGECPDMKDIPMMRNPEDGLEGSIGDAGKVAEPSFTCAQVWQTKGEVEDLLSCNGLLKLKLNLVYYCTFRKNFHSC